MKISHSSVIKYFECLDVAPMPQTVFLMFLKIVANETLDVGFENLGPKNFGKIISGETNFLGCF